MTKSDEEILQEQAEDAAQSKAKKQSLGKDILKGFASKNAPEFGQEGYGIPLKTKAASQKHVDTMHLLAAASKKKLSENR
jgi:hypothetical protein